MGVCHGEQLLYVGRWSGRGLHVWIRFNDKDEDHMRTAPQKAKQGRWKYHMERAAAMEVRDVRDRAQRGRRGLPLACTVLTDFHSLTWCVLAVDPVLLKISIGSSRDRQTIPAACRMVLGYSTFPKTKTDIFTLTSCCIFVLCRVSC